jgi:hypothetical protein
VRLSFRSTGYQTIIAMTINPAIPHIIAIAKKKCMAKPPIRLMVVTWG